MSASPWPWWWRTAAALAEDAAEAVVIDIAPLPAVADRAAAESGPPLFAQTGSNLAGTLTAVKGDADAAFRGAAYVRRERFQVQRHTAVPMELRGLVAEWEGGRLTLHGAAKVPFPNRRILAKQLGVPEAAIRMVENDVGGGFGVRGEFYPEDFLIPFAARLTGRPVKWIEDRREHFLATNHARDVACELEIACDSDGTILALRGHANADVGAYLRTNGATGARNTAQILSGPYRVPNIHMRVSLLVTNKTPVGTYRGPGRFEADFFRERLFDMAANDLGIDPVEFRRRNLIAESEMPYPLARVVELDLATETDSGDYRITFERCLAEIGWAEKSALQGKLVDGRCHGLAVGCYFEGGASGPRESARLVLERDGSVSVYVGSSANGQGLETVFGQIAADALEMPLDRIRGVFHGSTDLVREGFGSYSSRSVVMGGSAIIDAAGKLRGAIRTAAARRLGCAAADILLADGAARGPERNAIALADLAADEISAEGSYASAKRTYSYGAHAAHVAVDPRTGAVEVIDYVAVEDVGRIINPATLHGQTVGAIVQGLGGVFLEHLVYDAEGQLLTGSLADYLLADRERLSRHPRRRAGGKAGAAQSARRQGRRRGRHHPGRRRDRQRHRRGAAPARRRAARIAAVAAAPVGADRRGARRGVEHDCSKWNRANHPNGVIPGRALARTRNPGGRAWGSWIPGSPGACHRPGQRPATFGLNRFGFVGGTLPSSSRSPGQARRRRY